MTLKTIRFILLSIAFLFAFQIQAKKQGVINLGDELIEGNLENPELLTLLNRKKRSFKNLIKLRENFLPEMRRSAENILHQSRGREHQKE